MAATLHFDAVITGNRSLGPQGFKVLIAVVVALNLLVGGAFYAIGGVLAPVFLGLDVLGLVIAFHVNYRAARRRERVRVTAEEVRVELDTGAQAGDARVVWRSPTAFTRVEVEGDRETARVRLALSDKSRVIARDLSPGERLDLGDALQRAIRSARAERYVGEAR